MYVPRFYTSLNRDVREQSSGVSRHVAVVIMFIVDVLRSSARSVRQLLKTVRIISDNIGKYRMPTLKNTRRLYSSVSHR